ncbi:oxidoreductase [Corynebacterium striatum]|uniref:oxidoreductase n=1 Tax=Corynebacterium striatum TaxID=43770 RepID=UPI0034D76206
MAENDPLAPLFALPGVENAAAQAVQKISRAHRRPAGLRKFDVISAESAMRGARAAVFVEGLNISPNLQPEDAADGPLANAISAYSVLAPEVQSTTVRTFARSPLQVLARLDVAAGGTGIPAASGATRVQALARLISSGSGMIFDRLLPVVLHAELAAYDVFGSRSHLIGMVAARIAAIHSGFDPRGFAVPETYYNRHRDEYWEAISAYPEQPGKTLEFLLKAWAAGGEEADGIARSA